MLERSIAQTNIEYGGFTPAVSNVVFVHGSVDPWHAMGVLEDLTPQATSIYITGRVVASSLLVANANQYPGTSHCADMYPASGSDPEELTLARENIGNLLKEWVCQYYEC